MNYRSMSFHQSHPNLELVKLGASLGFNDICFQTEGGTLGPLKELRKRADELGYFSLAKELGLSISLWTHELEDYDNSWGAVSLENEKIWDAISSKYDYILNELFPETNYLVLTVVESEKNLTDKNILLKLVEVLNERCKKYGKKIILRSFVWHQEELFNVQSAIAEMPDDVIIMTKNVPQDWHLRSIPDTLIGNVGKKTQFVELDIAGEYFRMEHVANCFTDLIRKQYEYWKKSGCDGISVRVDRGWQPERHQNIVLNQAQEVNLWYLGYLSTGKDTEQAWVDYANHTFGAKSSEIMIKALKPTGEVIAESLCVERETFGDTRSMVPAIEVMKSFKGSTNSRYIHKVKKEDTAKVYTDIEDKVWMNPFHYNWSLFRWDKSFEAMYQKIRQGDPEIILRKTKSYEKALALADESIALINGVKADLPEGAYDFFNFKLEENKYNLITMCEISLAWLKCERRIRSDSDTEKQILFNEIIAHLKKLEALNKRKDESVSCVWHNKRYLLKRGEYLDIPEFLVNFKRYWQLYEITVDTRVIISDTSQKKVGININYLRDDNRNLPDARPIQEALKEMGVKFLRYPGGEKSDYYLWSVPPYKSPKVQVFDREANTTSSGLTPEPYKSRHSLGHYLLDFDKFMEYCKSVGATPHIVVGATHFESYENAPITLHQYIDNAVSWVRYANKVKNYGVKYWEIGNENWQNLSAVENAELALRFSRAMKEVDPTINIGISGNSKEYFRTILEKAGEEIDFLVCSNYPCYNWGTYDYYVQSKNINLIYNAADAVQAINNYNDGQYKEKIKVVAAEINSWDWSQNGWPEDNNLGHAIVTFDTFGQLLFNEQIEYGMLWGTRWMNYHGNRLSNALGSKNEIKPSGRAVAIWGQFLKDKLVSISRTDKIITYASMDLKGENLNLFLINKGYFDESVSITIDTRIEDRTCQLFQFKGTGPYDLNPTFEQNDSIELNNNSIHNLLLPAVSITVVCIKLCSHKE